MLFRFLSCFTLLVALASAVGAQPYSWNTTTNLPEKRSQMTAYGWNGHVYVVAGVNTTQDVDGHANYAEIMPDHSLGSWNSGPSVTTDLYQTGGGIHADSGWIYVAGGVSTGSPLADVFYSKLNPDGTFGSWQTANSLPEGTSSPASTVHNGYLYVIGGGHHFADYDGSNTTYFAKIQSDGSLSSWDSTTPYPFNLLRSLCIGAGNKLYVIGGERDAYGWLTDSVFYADINIDGTLGSWTPTTLFPRAAYGMNGYVFGNTLVVGGGLDSTGARDSIYSTSINPDGSLSSWNGAGVMPVAVGLFGMVRTSDAVYILGGEDAIGYTDSCFYSSAVGGEPQISSISDVPHDQGGKVTIRWSGSPLDTDLNNVPSYSIWRAIPPGQYPAMAFRSGGGAAELADARVRIRNLNGVEYFWEWIADQPAHKFAEYSYTASTLYDSSETTDGKHYFFVSTETSDPDVFYDSNVDSGHSVDNIAPLGPQMISGAAISRSVGLSWSPNTTDPDFSQFTIYRGTTPGFTPDGSHKIGVSADTSYVDLSPPIMLTLYYRVGAKDVHGNESEPSGEMSVPYAVTMDAGVEGGWNIVSVPLVTDDYSIPTLYPGASGDFYSYGPSGYVTTSELQNGRGYWGKFPAAQSTPVIGLHRTSDTVDVTEGWNMIGTPSISIPVTEVGSIPGGIEISYFYSYEKHYELATDLLPGRGYWVKVGETGKLILGGVSAAVAAARVRVSDDGETPPAPPQSGVSDLSSVTSYRLNQNYPNPFNPVTEIRYELPAGAVVQLSVFNLLGQEIARLVDAHQEAGSHSVTFDASGYPSGVYSYRMTAGGYSDTRRMMILK